MRTSILIIDAKEGGHYLTGGTADKLAKAEVVVVLLPEGAKVIKDRFGDTKAELV